MNNTKYIAIIGDIINSKEISNRNEVQIQLKETLNEINKKYSSNIASQFMITLGDEFQGLLTKQDEIFDIINFIELNMYPTKIRFGIGVGPIDTDINQTNSIEIIGPAYYKARNNINILNNIKNKNEKILTNVIIDSGGDYTNEDHLINTILSLIYISKSKWNDNAIKTIKLYIKNNHNQLATAQQLNVQQPAVSKTLKRCNYYTIENSYNEIRYILKGREKRMV
ncbi:MAG: SatD family protein [Erysipelotrichaceae bacterium]|nr:SatD family protein [Erysipelotrichaceae bacterium]